MEFDFLDEIQAMLVNWASDNNVDLRSSFEDEDQFKMFVLAIAISRILMMEHGVDLRQAFDTALGEGEYEKLASKISNN